MINTSIISESSKHEEKDHYVLFSSYEDASSEYKMYKIRLNSSEYVKFFKDVKEKDLSVVGFYGCFQTSLKLSEIFLKRPIEYKIDTNEGLYAYKHENRLALVLKTTSEIFNFKLGTDSNHLITTYLRYLVDVCQHIYAVFPETLDMNPDNSNPYEAFVNPSFSL